MSLIVVAGFQLPFRLSLLRSGVDGADVLAQGWPAGQGGGEGKPTSAASAAKGENPFVRPAFPDDKIYNGR